MTTNNVVSDQHSAVIQNQTTGQIDFLRFNGSTLQSSALRDYGIAGWNVVANGGFNASGGLIASDLVANTVGLPTAVGVGESLSNWPVFANNGAQGNDNVLVQYPDGTISAIGFTGSTVGGLTYSNSFARGPIPDQ